MKKIISIAALVLAVVLTASLLTACKPADGNYTLVTVKDKDGNDMSSEIARLESYGVKAELIIEGDKATFLGDEARIDGEKIVVGDESYPLSVNDNKITVEHDGFEYTFEKK